MSRFNAALAALAETDGTLSELSKKWYDGTDLTKMQ